MPPKLTDDTVITFRQDNPKKKGAKAHERYERYKVATTVGEAIRLGALRADITSDMKAGHCSQDGAAPPPGGAEAAAAVQKRRGPAVASPQLSKRRPAPEPEDVALAPAVVPAPEPAPAIAAPIVAAPALAVAEPARPVPTQAPGVRPPSSAGQSTPSSSSSNATAPMVRALAPDIDLSFAKMDNKPLKYVKRVTGEARRILGPQGAADAKEGGYKFELADRSNLSKWKVTLSDLNVDGQLAKDLKKHNLPASIDIELSLPDGFPMEPPFARVLYPQLSSGFVFSRGGICFEPLTAKGWAPSMTMPALAIAIKGIMDYGGVRVSGVGDKVARRIPDYTEDGARRDHAAIVSAHRGGEGSTYGGKYKS